MSKTGRDIIYPNPTPANVTLEKNRLAPMRDGVKIAVDIYRPTQGEGPWPAILAYSPFQKERSFESPKPAFYCSRGYVLVQAAERGSGFSEGKFEFHGSKAAEDGYDLVEWIAGTCVVYRQRGDDGGLRIRRYAMAHRPAQSTASQGPRGSGNNGQLPWDSAIRGACFANPSS